MILLLSISGNQRQGQQTDPPSLVASDKDRRIMMILLLPLPVISGGGRLKEKGRSLFLGLVIKEVDN
jgi:hypothetical protein